MISFGAKKLGYHLPTEWDEQEATWLIWPKNTETWNADVLPLAQEEFARFVSLITQSQKVKLLIDNYDQIDLVESMMKGTDYKVDRLQFFIKKSNDAWMRDCGPDFLLHTDTKEKIIINWEYNAWGEKYPPFEDDNEIPLYIADQLGLKQITTDFVLEGGSFETNGQGYLITTKSCLLHPNRNPFYDLEIIEEVLKKYLGVTTIIWLDEGIVGDDTDGHVDDFCRFLPNDKILLAQPLNENDPNFEVLSKAKAQLLALDQFEVVDIPMPKRVMSVSGVVLPASYVNYCITNSHVIVPVFEDENDSVALNIIQECFPDKEVVGLPAINLLEGLGGFHCLSKHEPK